MSEEHAIHEGLEAIWSARELERDNIELIRSLGDSEQVVVSGEEGRVAE